jgi:hypothetical protein
MGHPDVWAPTRVIGSDPKWNRVSWLVLKHQSQPDKIPRRVGTGD